MTTFKIWKCTKAGSLSNLILQEQPLSQLSTNLKQNHLLIKVKSIGLNFADIFAIHGLYSATPKGEFTPGLEFSGVIEQIGTHPDDSIVFNKTKFQIGDRVMGMTRFGSYTSHIVVHVNNVRHLPKEWSFEEGAAFCVQALTAWYGLIELGALKRNQKVLIHSIAGGVGLYALNICKNFGAIPIGTVGRPNKVDFLIKEKGMSKDTIIVRTTPTEFKNQLKEALATIDKNINGVDIIFDSLGGDYFPIGYEMLERGGRIIVFGAGTFMNEGNSPNWLSLAWKYIWRPKLDPMQMMTDNKSVMGFNLIWMTDKVEYLNSLLDDMMQVKWDKPHVGRVFDFEDCVKALQYFQTGENIGKIVLKINS